MYVWGRRHQHVTLSFLGMFNFTAPYLPWVLLGFSVVLGSSPVVDLLGMVAGTKDHLICPSYVLCLLSIAFTVVHQSLHPAFTRWCIESTVSTQPSATLVQQPTVVQESSACPYVSALFSKFPLPTRHLQFTQAMQQEHPMLTHAVAQVMHTTFWRTCTPV